MSRRLATEERKSRISGDKSACRSVVVPRAVRSVCSRAVTAAGMRVEVDERGERMNAKIRDAQRQKIPYMLVVGDQEVANGQVALRLRSGENPGPMALEAFLEKVQQDIEAGN